VFNILIPRLINDFIDLYATDFFSLMQDSGVMCTTTVVTMAMLDFELRSLYDLEVVAKDGQGHIEVNKVKVHVQDTNDPPSVSFLF
jgi:hypothetical protein